MGPSLLHAALRILLQASAAGRPLRLDDAVQAGLRQHPSIKTAGALANAAEARADEAKAPLFPQLTGVASYQRIRRANLASTGVVTGPAPGTPGAGSLGIPSTITGVTSPGG